MRPAARHILVVALLCAIIGCGKPSGIRPESSSSSDPQNLVLEKEISGSILGQRLGQPLGVAADRRGFLYVTDASNNRILRFQTDFTPEQAIGSLGRQQGFFDQPGDIDVDRVGNAFVCDMNNRRLVRLDIHFRPTLEIQLIDATEALKYGEASAIAVGDNGEIWMTDRDRNRIAVFDLTGTFVRFSGDIEAGKGMLSRPTGIAYRGKDGFVVCDTENGRLVYFDQYGNYLFDLSLGGMNPTAVAVDSIGNAWVLDAYSAEIVYVIQTGANARIGGPVLVGLRQPLVRPTDIAVLGHGLLAVADTGNDRVAILRIVGTPPPTSAN